MDEKWMNMDEKMDGMKMDESVWKMDEHGPPS